MGKQRLERLLIILTPLFQTRVQNTNQITAKIKGAAIGIALQKISSFEQATGQQFTDKIQMFPPPLHTDLKTEQY